MGPATCDLQHVTCEYLYFFDFLSLCSSGINGEVMSDLLKWNVKVRWFG